MPLRTRVSQRGGQKLKRILEEAEKAKRQPRITVGLLAGSKRPDGTPTASAAAENEFGVPADGIPERPAFRQSIAILEGELPELVRRLIDPATLTLTEADAKVIGAHAVGVIRDRITDLDRPENTPATLAKKKGNSPLVDSGLMRDQIDYRVD